MDEDGWIDRCMDGKMDGWLDHMDGWSGYMLGKTDIWMDEKMGEREDGWMDGFIDR